MAMYSDALGQALSKFRVDDRGVSIVTEMPIIVHLEGLNLQRIVSSADVDHRTRIGDVIVAATKHLIETYNGILAYSHAGEVSLLVRFRDSQRKDIGTYVDMATSVASTLSAAIVHFAKEIVPSLFSGAEQRLVLPQFSAKPYVFPEDDYAAKFFLWRESVARSSSVEALALKHFTADDLAGKSSVDRKGMLAAKGVSFDEMPEHFRRGSFIRRYKVERMLDPWVIAKIPEAHRPKGPVAAITVGVIAEVPPLSVVHNLTEFVFSNAVPSVADRPFAAAITP